ACHGAASAGALAEDSAMDQRSLIILLLVGLVAGWLASLVVGGGGLLRYLVLGVIGSYVGGFLFSALNLRLGLGNQLVEQIIVATVGAIVVALIARFIA
ncbi:GlsB/YeaQ/YmgE family stress response membrane protein, partial [Mycobacterium tuberculosis]|nr:GlsB/YeaQ/YmgE family stress response membrane protein [Mycobacterium tuberculosis]